ncbi:MAG: sugar-binding transcriptional regulator [Anaerolineae bacterium]|nr:sugar-binding transcriptional regulator [Thermoflexales bacterium]MDW8396114.1 sugar-binding transcriptional regulator [Anaerolineae bacterium]
MSSHKQVSTERQEMLAHIAELYFVRGLNQSEIAERTSYSRSMISRLLTEARNQGIVEIRIHHPLRRSIALEGTLQRTFNLHDVRVVEASATHNGDALHRVGMMAAHLLGELLREGITIGVSWGSALSATVDSMRQRFCPQAHVVQMIGSLGTRLPNMDGAEIARQLARAIGATYTTLPAPMLVGDEGTRDGLLRDARIREVFAQARRAAVALLGIGAIEPAHSALVRAGFVKPRESLEMQHAGAVGDVCAIPVDLHGRVLSLPISRRVIGVDAQTLSQIHTRIGIACGEVKVKPILGALRSRLINVLVTDEATASAVLKLNQETLSRAAETNS